MLLQLWRTSPRFLISSVSIETGGECVWRCVESHLVSRSELGPRFIRSPVVVFSVCALNILVETQNLPRLEFSYGGPLGQLVVESGVLKRQVSRSTTQQQWWQSRHIVKCMIGSLYHILTFLVSLRLISDLSSRRSASFLAAAGEKTFHKNDGGKKNTLQAVRWISPELLSARCSNGKL